VFVIRPKAPERKKIQNDDGELVPEEVDEEELK
jgi:hypothetical protein